MTAPVSRRAALEAWLEQVEAILRRARDDGTPGDGRDDGVPGRDAA